MFVFLSEKFQELLEWLNTVPIHIQFSLPGLALLLLMTAIIGLWLYYRGYRDGVEATRTQFLDSRFGK